MHLHSAPVPLLLLFALLGGCQSPFAAPAIRQVEQHGGFVSWEWNPKQVTFYNPSRRTQMDDAEFAEVSGALACLRNLERVDLTATDITDRSLSKVARLRDLRQVYLAATQVTPAGVLELRPLPRLEYLTVPSERFSEEDIRRLQAEMPEVRFGRIEAAQAHRLR